MRSVYILLVNSDTLISRIIRTTTGAEYTHASISFSEDIFPLCSFGRKYALSMFPAGLKLEPLDSGFFKYNKDIPCGLYKIEVTDEQYQRAKEYVSNLFNDKKRHGFNLIGLVACKFGIPISRKRRMFCSEFVASVLSEANIIKFPKPSLVQPRDFMNVDGIVCLYEGKLKDLKEKITKGE